MCKNFAVTVRQKGIPFAAQIDGLDNLDGFLERDVASDNTELPCGIKFGALLTEGSTPMI